MESEAKIAARRRAEQESKRPSDEMRAARPNDDSLFDDEERITVRAPIAKLIGD